MRPAWLVELRLAARGVGRARLFTAMAALTLALGVGGNAAVYRLVDTVLLRSLPYPEPDALVTLWNGYRDGALSRTVLSPGEYADYVERSRAFSGIAAFSNRGLTLTGAGEPEPLQALAVTPNLFQVLGVRARIGRGFRRDEGGAADARVVVLGHDLWVRRFGADPSVVGRTVRLNDLPHTVVGVLPREVRFPENPASFHLPAAPALWIAEQWLEHRTESRGNQYLRTVARLAPGATAGSVRADLARIGARFRDEYRDRYSDEVGWHPAVVPLRDVMLGGVRPLLLLLLGAAGLVLLIASANTASLFLARGDGRHTEMAVRRALGGGRGALARQILAEAAMVAVPASAVAAPLAALLTHALRALAPASLPRLAGVAVDVRVPFLAAAATLAAALLAGLLPALRLSRTAPSGALREGGRGDTRGRSSVRILSALVVAEVSFACMVLVGTGLLVRSFVALQRVDPGFRAENLLTFKLVLPRSRYDDAGSARAAHEEIVRRIEALPGVERAGRVMPMPLGGDVWSGSFFIEGRPVAPGGPEPHAEYAVATPGYFDAMAIGLLEGRVFTEADGPESPEVVVVDEMLARRYWPGESALGKRIGGSSQRPGEWTVVGVVRHVRNAALHLDGEPQIYQAHAQAPGWSNWYVVRSTVEPATVVGSVRATIAALDPRLAIAAPLSMEDRVAASKAERRFALFVMLGFALAAAALAAVGLYGLLSLVVGQRRRELGIRIALGARPRDVLVLVLRQGVTLTAAGLAVGFTLALIGGRWIASLLFGVAANDATTFGGIALALILIALAASAPPALRALGVDPNVAIRDA